MKKSLYDILEIQPDAEAEQIDLAYRTLIAAAEADPDTNRRVLLKEAHSILANPRQRAAYDASQLRATQAPEAVFVDQDDDGGTGPRRWPLWLLIGILLVGGIYWWQARSKRQAIPVILSQTTVPDASQPANDAPTDSRAASADKSPEELYSSLSGSVALVVVANSGGIPIRSGSGVVIDSGAVITNCHVTKGSAQIKVKVAGRVHDATLLTTDEVFDLCRLSVTGLAANPVNIGSVSTLRTGQKVYAIGAPHGLELTISDGIVSSLRETPTGTYIQTTAPISPGSSGGGLFSAAGQLVGVVTFQHRFGQNLNFAVPADWIGEMRERSAPAGMESEPAAESPKRDAATAGASALASRIVGNWHCFRPALGRHMDLQFQPGGSMTVTSNGKTYQGRYEVVGNVLTLHGSDTISVTVDELGDRRMNLGANNDKRMACDRQG